MKFVLEVDPEAMETIMDSAGSPVGSWRVVAGKQAAAQTGADNE